MRRNRPRRRFANFAGRRYRDPRPPGRAGVEELIRLVRSVEGYDRGRECKPTTREPGHAP